MDFNILGMGLPEMLVIGVLLMAVAGPKRMVRWAYMLGRYLSQIRAYADEAMGAMKREIEAADPELMNELKQVNQMRRQRFDIVSEANKLIATPKAAPVATPATTTVQAASEAAVVTATVTTTPPQNQVMTTAAAAGMRDLTLDNKPANLEQVNPDTNTPDTNGQAGDQPRTYDAWLPR